MNSTIFNFRPLKRAAKYGQVHAAKLIVITFVMGSLLPFSFFILTHFVKSDTIHSLALDTIDDSPRVIFLGSSHVNTNIDPREMPGKVSLLGLPNADYQDLLRILQLSLDRGAKPSLLVLEWIASSLLRGPTEERAMTLRFSYGLSPILDLKTCLKNPNHCLRDRLYVLYQWRFIPTALIDDNFRPLSAGEELIPGFERINNTMDASEAMATSVDRLKTLDAQLDRDAQAKNLQALAQIVSIAQGMKIPLNILKTPLHRELRAILPHYFAMPRPHAIAQFPLFDFTEWEGETDGQFADHDHLNASGARAFSQVLAKRIYSSRMGTEGVIEK